VASLVAARGAAGAVAVTVVWAAAVTQWALGDLVVPWDSKNQSYPFFRFLASTIHSGATPFWNPNHYAGHPSLADPQSLIFSPAFLIWALFDPAPSSRGRRRQPSAAARRRAVPRGRDFPRRAPGGVYVPPAVDEKSGGDVPHCVGRAPALMRRDAVYVTAPLMYICPRCGQFEPKLNHCEWRQR
jgi:hypothetical protein